MLGRSLKKKIKECITKKQKYVVFLFPLLITGIFMGFKVKFEASDERIKNEGAITFKTFERTTVESTVAATPNHPIVTKAEQASGIEQMLQELRDNKNACIQAQREKK